MPSVKLESRAPVRGWFSSVYRRQSANASNKAKENAANRESAKAAGIPPGQAKKQSSSGSSNTGSAVSPDLPPSSSGNGSGNSGGDTAGSNSGSNGSDGGNPGGDSSGNSSGSVAAAPKNEPVVESTAPAGNTAAGVPPPSSSASSEPKPDASTPPTVDSSSGREKASSAERGSGTASEKADGGTESKDDISPSASSELGSTPISSTTAHGPVETSTGVSNTPPALDGQHPGHSRVGVAAGTTIGVITIFLVILFVLRRQRPAHQSSGSRRWSWRDLRDRFFRGQSKESRRSSDLPSMREALLSADVEHRSSCDSPDLAKGGVRVPILRNLERPTNARRKSSTDLVLRTYRPQSPTQPVSPMSAAATATLTPKSSAFAVALQPVPPHPPPSMPLPQIPRNMSPSALSMANRSSTGSVNSRASSKRSSRSSGRQSPSLFSEASDPFHYDKEYGPLSPAERPKYHSGWSEWLSDVRFADHPEIPRASRIKRESASSLGAVSIASSGVFSPSLHSQTVKSHNSGTIVGSEA